MKTKKFGMKLNLQKETVANLNSSSMNAIQGGLLTETPKCGPTMRVTCPVCHPVSFADEYSCAIDCVIILPSQEC